MNRQLRPFDPDFCFEDGCGAFGFRRALVDDLPFVMQRHLHHIPDDYFTSQAAGTSSMDDTSYPITPDLVWNTSRMRCILLPNVPITCSVSLISL
jgi:hypothetical protein